MPTSRNAAQTLELVHDPFPGVRNGRNALVLRGIAVPLLLVGVLFGLVAFDDFTVDGETIGAVLFLLFGLICWAGASNQKRMDFRFNLHLDPIQRELRCFKADPARALVVPFGRVLSLRARAESVGGADGESRTRYSLYAILRDGSELWLLSRFTRAEAIDAIRGVQAVLEVPTGDEAELGVVRELEVPVEEDVSLPPRPPPSPALRLTPTPDGLRFALRQTKSWSERITLLLVAGVFLLIPLMMAIETVQGLLADPHPAALAAGAFMVSILGAAIAGGAVGLLTLLQDYRIELQPTRLVVEQRFRLGPLQRWLGRELSVPRSAVQGVRVHIRHGGEVRLSLRVQGPPTVRAPVQLFARGAFREDLDGQVELPLWTLPSSAHPAYGPTLSDLVWIEHELQKRLGVEDG